MCFTAMMKIISARCRHNMTGQFCFNFSYWDVHDPIKEITPSEEYTSISETDLRNISFINDIWDVAESNEIIAKTAAVAPVALWGIFGNVLLLFIIIRNSNHRRSPTCLLVGNMAFADLIFLTIFPAIFLVYDFFQNYQLGWFGCKIEGGLECAVLLASVMSLLAISYDRLTVIALPRDTRLSLKSTKIVIIVSWILAFTIATPLFVFREYKERQWKDFLEKYCTENTLALNIYWHVIITMLVWLPLLIMLVCYITIFVKLYRYEKKVKSTQAVMYKKKAVKMISTVLITFLICRSPFTALIFYRNYLLKHNNISKTNSVQNQANGVFYVLWFISKYLICVNAAVNPIIYGLLNEKFKKELKVMILNWILPIKESQKSKENKTGRTRKDKSENKTQNSSLLKNLFSRQKDNEKGRIFLISNQKMSVNKT